MQEDKISPELKDICEMLSRYVEANRNTVCPQCGDECDHEVSDEASRVLAYGDKETLRELLNELRDMIEDEADEDGYVNY